ncbi:RluA family pseudouridine synthase [Roseivirga sp. BDSF3-8]|uniref:RluA family pseudouridine synthase n=1 Tax=Roseivirga sp. BDSF3-8 TaxID=3241598 RepID=UPI0035318FD9
MKKIRFEELILFENEDYIIINKPPFISTLDDRAEPDSVLALARDYLPEAQIAHRLDKETSGALAIAKNPAAYRHLAIQFERRKVEKLYHAVCDGIHDFDEVEVNLPLYSLNKGVVRIDYGKGKESKTYFTTKEAFKMHTLVECRPITGRMHQIRVHLSSMKAPISGDETYGGRPLFLSKLKRHYNLKRDTEELPIIRRFALHASNLAFDDEKGQRIDVQAPYPKDFAVAIKQLSKYR